MPWRGHRGRPPRRRGGPRRGRDAGLPAVLRLRRGGLGREEPMAIGDTITVAGRRGLRPRAPDDWSGRGAGAGARGAGPALERAHARRPGAGLPGVAAGVRAGRGRLVGLGGDRLPARLPNTSAGWTRSGSSTGRWTGPSRGSGAGPTGRPYRTRGRRHGAAGLDDPRRGVDQAQRVTPGAVRQSRGGPSACSWGPRRVRPAPAPRAGRPGPPRTSPW